MKAIWKGIVLIESDDAVVVEDNQYYSAAALRKAFSSHRLSKRLSMAEHRKLL